jgi:hypothetical protein
MAYLLLHFIIALAVRILIAALCLIASIAVYRLYFHPLSRIPGPRLAALSNIWQAYHARNGRMLELGKTLHRRYGKAVRVGPSSVWFDSKEAFSKIYSKSASTTNDRRRY